MSIRKPKGNKHDAKSWKTCNGVPSWILANRESTRKSAEAKKKRGGVNMTVNILKEHWKKLKPLPHLVRRRLVSSALRSASAR